MSLPDLVARARADGDFSRVIDAVPYYRFLGLSARMEDSGLIIVMPGDPKHVGRQDPPYIHGGVIGALLEAAALLQLLAADTTHVARTINITTDYLRPARVIDTFASATILRQGRRVANVRVEAWQEERAKPVAQAHGHFLLV